MSKATEKNLFGGKPTSKKIKRRLHYEVVWWLPNLRSTYYCESASKMRSFVNRLHLSHDGLIEIEKTWCYREHHPRHKSYYVSERPGHFECVERW